MSAAEMKLNAMKTHKSVVALTAFLGALLCADAQSYSINWYKIAGGGGTSSGGTYQLSGTIGQQDAGGPMAGGTYSLTGGFWALLAVLQTPGLPNLSIARNGTNSVIVFWADTGVYTLQNNGNLSTTNWTTYGGTITTTNGTNYATITPPSGKLFFRLMAP